MSTDEGTTRLLLRLAAQSTLACLSCLAVWSVLPLLLGWHPSVVMSGSMEPAIRPGDVVVTRHVPVAQVRPHQVVLVRDPDHPGRLRLHRLVRVDQEGRLVLKGDANRRADSSPVRLTDLRGVAVLRVPLIGSPAQALRTGDRPRAAAMVGFLILLIGLAQKRGRRGPGEPPRQDEDVLTPVAPDRRGRPQLVLPRLVSVGLVAPLLALSGPADFAGFVIAAANPTNRFTAAASFYPYKDAVLADTPVLYWRLGETSGTIAANSATLGPAGTYFTSPALGQPSALTSEIVNKSISTSSGGSVTASTSATPPVQFTIEAWIRTTTTAGGRIFGFGDRSGTTTSTTPDRQLYLSPAGTVVAGIRKTASAKSVATSPLSYNDGQWHYLAATYSASTLRLYVDGAQVASTTTTATAAVTGYWRAGFENLSGWPTPPSGTAYAGGLDELAVYATALSAARISAHYLAATS